MHAHHLILLHGLVLLAHAEGDPRLPLPDKGASVVGAPNTFQYTAPTAVLATPETGTPSQSQTSQTNEWDDGIWSILKRQQSGDTGQGTATAVQASPAPVTVAPETTAYTGQVQTLYGSIAGLSGASQTTTVIAGTSTVLPVWNCNEKATASACKGCPSSAASVTNGPQCTPGFNALWLLPLAAVPGVFVVPPEGLPTLTIGSSGVDTYTDRSTTSSSSKSSSSSSSSTSTTSALPVACERPTNALGDAARPVEPTSLVGGGGGNSGPTFTGTPSTIDQDDLPMYPIWKAQSVEVGNPTKAINPPRQTAAMGCGGDGAYNHYFNSAFYQFPKTFSRQDGVRAIKSFCRDMAKQNKVLGHAGFQIKGATGDQAKLRAEDFLIGAYPGGLNSFTGQGVGLITVRAIFDVENRQKVSSPGDCAADGAPVFIFKDNEGLCTSLFGQSVDFCELDDKKPHNDQTAKKGGSFYKQCMFFEVFSSPNDSDHQGSRIGEGGAFQQN